MPLINISEPEQIKKEKQFVVGIDLGTTNSLIASVQNGELVIYKGEDGSLMLPSCVHYFSKDKVLVGNSAKEYVLTDPLNTITSSKRIIGKGISEVQDLNYNLSEEYKNYPSYNTAAGAISPVEVLATILKDLIERAKKGQGKSPDAAVITVPAYFDEASKNAVKDAAKLASIKVLRLINEPTAA